MKVYLLDSGGQMDGDYSIIGIFSTRENAENVKAERANYDDGDVDEIELDEYLVPNPLGRTYPWVKRMKSAAVATSPALPAAAP